MYSPHFGGSEFNGTFFGATVGDEKSSESAKALSPEQRATIAASAKEYTNKIWLDEDLKGNKFGSFTP